MEEKSTITTKEYMACVTCKKKMKSISLGGGSDFLGFIGGIKALYCNNKECDKFGYLTVAGIKIQE